MGQYELEKHRVYDYLVAPNEFTTIQKSDNPDTLRLIGNGIKLRSGKTFYEKLVINQLDENEDIIDVEEIKRTD